MQNLFYLLLLWLPALPLKAQSLAGTYIGLLPYSARTGHVLAVDANAATLAEIRQISFGCYGERRFMLRELAFYHGAVGWPAAGGGLALSTFYDGGGPGRQTRFSLVYARQMGVMQAGLHFDYHLSAAEGYGRRSFASAGGGVLLPLTPSLRTGLQFTCAAARNTSSLLPASFSSGLGYDMSPQFFIGCLVSKTEDRPAQVQAGIEYAPLAQVALRAGFDAATALYYFGVSLLWTTLRMEVTAAIHPQLGVTPGLGILYPSKPLP